MADWDVVSTTPVPAAPTQQPTDPWAVVSHAPTPQATQQPPNTSQPTEAQSWLSSPGARLVRDAVIDPALSGSNMLAGAAQTVASLGGRFPNPLSAYYGEAAKLTSGLQSKIDTPLDAANAAARNTPGYAAARAQADKSENAASLGALDQITAPLIPGTDAAIRYITHGGSSDVANATADAASQNLASYRAAHPELSTAAALAPAIASLGADSFTAARALSKTGSIASVPKAIAELKRAASAAYQTVDNSGMIIAQPSVRNLVTKIQTDLASQGFHPTLQPRTAAAFNMLNDAANNNQTLQGMDVLRRVAQHGVDPLNKSDTMMSRRMVDNIDDFVSGLGPTDVIGRVDKPALDALANARDMWGRAAKGQQIQGLIDKAALNGQSMVSVGSGNALRTQFRQLANNPRGMAKFSPAEQDAIRKTATGGPVENVLRLVGKLAPDQTIPLLGEMGAAAAGGPHMLAIPVAGALAKAGASAITTNNAKNAAELILRKSLPAAAMKAPKGLPLAASAWSLAGQQQQPHANGGKIMRRSAGLIPAALPPQPHSKGGFI